MKLSDLVSESSDHIQVRYEELCDEFVNATNRIDNVAIRQKLHDQFHAATDKFAEVMHTDNDDQIYAALDTIQRCVTSAIKYVD